MWTFSSAIIPSSFLFVSSFHVEAQRTKSSITLGGDMKICMSISALIYHLKTVRTEKLQGKTALLH